MKCPCTCAGLSPGMCFRSALSRWHFLFRRNWMLGTTANTCVLSIDAHITLMVAVLCEMAALKTHARMKCMHSPTHVTWLLSQMKCWTHWQAHMTCSARTPHVPGQNAVQDAIVLNDLSLTRLGCWTLYILGQNAVPVQAYGLTTAGYKSISAACLRIWLVMQRLSNKACMGCRWRYWTWSQDWTLKETPLPWPELASVHSELFAWGFDSLRRDWTPQHVWVAGGDTEPRADTEPSRRSNNGFMWLWWWIWYFMQQCTVNENPLA